MDTTTATITEFLLARIAEWEAAAERGRSHPDPTTFANDNYGYLWVQPARVLAQCEAMRRIVELHNVTSLEDEDGNDVGGGCACCAHLDWPCRTLRDLAAIWSDHPDYRDDWRP